ncbi:MAG: hypothetical protein H7833_13460 [Magnetococcus sp. DMHC-1]|nr:hypothetical protein [Magnetococcales bacterium]
MQKPKKKIPDPLLFRSQTPEHSRLVKELFQGRQQELDDGVAILQAGLDWAGKRGQAGLDKIPWVIHGETRSGKSHLARRILTELAEVSDASDAKDAWQIIVQARDRLDAVQVMQKIFDGLLGFYHACLVDARFPELSPDDKNFVQSTTELMDEVVKFSGGASSLVWKFSHNTTASLTGGIQAGPKIFKVLANLGMGGGSGEEVSLTLAPPTPERYALYCGTMVDTLLRVGRLRHLLVLVDDADLLEVEIRRPVSQEDKDRNQQRARLTEALVVLHREAGIDVLVTARSRFARSSKDFHDLLDLNEYPMSAEALAQIYAVQMRTFAAQVEQPEDFLLPETVLDAAKLSGFLPGIFLGHLKIAYAVHRREPENRPRDLNWYMGVFRNYFEQKRNLCSEGAEQLIQAISENCLECAVVDRDLFYGTDLDNVLVVQSYVTPYRYRIVPMMAEIMKSPSI